LSRRGATKVAPFGSVYEKEILLLIDVNLDAYRLDKQNKLSIVMYQYLMNNIDEVVDKRLKAIKDMKKIKPCQS
jgi:ubiquinone biosynthesis protein COQ9